MDWLLLKIKSTHAAQDMSDSYDDNLENVSCQERDIAYLRQRVETLESEHKGDVIGKL